MMKINMTILLGILLLMSACNVSAQQTYAHPEALVETAWLADHGQDANVRILDLSTQKVTYDQGHINGAFFVNASEWLNPNEAIRGQVLTAAQLETLLSRLGITPQTTLVLYDDNRSLMATRVFWALKF